MSKAAASAQTEAIECRFCPEFFTGPHRLTEYRRHRERMHADLIRREGVRTLEQEAEAVAREAEEAEGLKCPECGKRFTGPTAKSKVAVHRFGKHGIRSEKPARKSGLATSRVSAAAEAPARKPRGGRRPALSSDAVRQKIVCESADELADRAETLLEIVEGLAVTGSSNADEIDRARWRLGAAIANYREIREGADG